jgi:hypothetical protein
MRHSAGSYMDHRGVPHIDQIVEAHTAMEEGRFAGKIVVLT